MTLTLGTGPLAADAPDTTNYTLDGPQHKLLFSSFPRRIRGFLAGQTIVDSEHAMLLHESNIFPVLYIPKGDVSMDLPDRDRPLDPLPLQGRRVLLDDHRRGHRGRERGLELRDTT